MTLRFLTPQELHDSTPPEPEWLWDGYLAAGTVTLLAGKPKSGKSTLALAASVAIAEGATRFLGRRVQPSAVVYLSEEGAGTLISKIPACSAPLHVLTRDAAWPRPSWSTLVSEAVKKAQLVGARLLTIDTAPFWTALPPEREKDAGAVLALMQPLTEATRAGIAVQLVLHARKAGGEDGDAIRGSSAWAGSADTILELERPRGDNVPPRQRLLAAIGRFPSTPGLLLVDHHASTGAWRLVGEGTHRRDTRSVTTRAVLLEFLPVGAPGVTREELVHDTDIPWQQLGPCMKDLIKENAVVRDDRGVKGDPHRFWKGVHHNARAQHRTACVQQWVSRAAGSGVRSFRNTPESKARPDSMVCTEDAA